METHPKVKEGRRHGIQEREIHVVRKQSRMSKRMGSTCYKADAVGERVHKCYRIEEACVN